MRRVVVPVLVAFVIVLATAGVAFGHVTVSPTQAPQGGNVNFTFSVPNESDTASTVKLQITMPTDPSIASVRAQVKPGWAISVQKTGSTVTQITWTGGPINPDEFDVFTIAAGPLPKAKTLTFKAVQTYSDGQVVSWIEPQVKGTPEPEHPAPVVTIKGKVKSSD
jgi:uncharacterized protein